MATFGDFDGKRGGQALKRAPLHEDMWHRLARYGLAHAPLAPAFQDSMGASQIRWWGWAIGFAFSLVCWMAIVGGLGAW